MNLETFIEIEVGHKEGVDITQVVKGQKSLTGRENVYYYSGKKTFSSM